MARVRELVPGVDDPLHTAGIKCRVVGIEFDFGGCVGHITN